VAAELAGDFAEGGQQARRACRDSAGEADPASDRLLRVRRCIRGRRRNYMVSHLIKSPRSRWPHTRFFAGGVSGISGRRCHFHPELHASAIGVVELYHVGSTGPFCGDLQ
jgi:hypothetical protein